MPLTAEGCSEERALESFLSYENFLDKLKDTPGEKILSNIATVAVNFIKYESHGTYSNRPGETQRQLVCSSLFSLIDSSTDEALRTGLFQKSRTTKMNESKPPESAAFDTSVRCHGNSPDSRLLLMEYFERYLIEKYFNVFQAFLYDAIEKDAELYWKMTWMKEWIRPQHLEVDENLVQVFYQSDPSHKEAGVNLIKLISSQLALLDRIHYPKGKISIFLRVCRIVFQVISFCCRRSPFDCPLRLSNALKVWYQKLSLKDRSIPRNNEEDDDDAKTVLSHESRASYHITADDILPVLVWVTIQSCSRSLLSHLAFTHYFRHPTLLVSENLYYLTMFQSAAEFVYTLKVSKSLHMPDFMDHKRCIESCPEQNVVEWIGEVWNTNTTVDGIPQIALGDCKPLPTPFSISAMLFIPSTYNEVLKALGNPSYEKVLTKLYVYINQVFSQTASLDEVDQAYRSVNLKALPDIFRPVYVYQTISLCVRLILEMDGAIFCKTLEKFVEEKKISLNINSDSFKLKFFKIILLTECIERLLFLQIYERLFPYLIGLLCKGLETKSLYDTLAFSFFSGRNLLKKNAEKFGEFLFLQHSKSYHNPKQLCEITDSSVFFRTCEKLKSLTCRTDLYEALPFAGKPKKRLHVVLKRLIHLVEYTNPLDKLKTFVALQNFAEWAREILFTNNEQSEATAIAALLLIYTTPKFLRAHVVFTDTYRHPVLCCREVDDAIGFLWFVIHLIESMSTASTGSITNYSSLLRELVLAGQYLEPHSAESDSKSE